MKFLTKSYVEAMRFRQIQVVVSRPTFAVAAELASEGRTLEAQRAILRNPKPDAQTVTIRRGVLDNDGVSYVDEGDGLCFVRVERANA